jgi:kynureninase
VKDALIARGTVVDYRPGAGIRIAPHFYNTAEECEAVIEDIERLLAIAR